MSKQFTRTVTTETTYDEQGRPVKTVETTVEKDTPPSMFHPWSPAPQRPYVHWYDNRSFDGLYQPTLMNVTSDTERYNGAGYL